MTQVFLLVQVTLSMWKSKIRVMSGKLPVQIYESRVQFRELQDPIHKLGY